MDFRAQVKWAADERLRPSAKTGPQDDRCWGCEHRRPVQLGIIESILPENARIWYIQRTPRDKV